MNTRDSDALNMRVTRTVPVWSLVSALAIVGAAAVRMDAQQSRQGELQVEQGKRTTEVSSKLDVLSGDLNKMNLKGIENEFRLGDLDRRMRAIENAPAVIQPIRR